MADYKWKGRARIVACIDLVFSIIGIILLILLLTLLVNNSNGTEMVWFLVFLAIIVCITEVFLAVNLIKATKSDIDLESSMELAVPWSRFNIIVSVLGLTFWLLNVIIYRRFSFDIIGLAVRILFIYVVECFLWELATKKETVENEKPPPPFASVV